MSGPDELKSALQGLASGAFPDDSDVRWEVRNVVERAGFHAVEAEPIPSTVGYPRLRFIIAQDPSGSFRLHACYCLDEGRWSLLFTSPGTSEDWRGLAFDG